MVSPMFARLVLDHALISQSTQESGRSFSNDSLKRGWVAGTAACALVAHHRSAVPIRCLDFLSLRRKYMERSGVC
jgi:hypothetical protein